VTIIKKSIEPIISSNLNELLNEFLGILGIEMERLFPSDY